MFKPYPDEEFKEVDVAPFIGKPVKYKYAISNYGRYISFEKSIEDGTLLKPTILRGAYWYRHNSVSEEGKRSVYAVCLHRLVAEYFLPKPTWDQRLVLHLDYNVFNNHVSNLVWASQKDVSLHHLRNPEKIAKKEARLNAPDYKGHKLTAAKVKMIKQLIFDPERKTRMKMIAKQFQISEMQLYRIKSGENWGHVKI